MIRDASSEDEKIAGIHRDDHTADFAGEGEDRRIRRLAPEPYDLDGPLRRMPPSLGDLHKRFRTALVKE
jgi:hypothetical protein